MIDLFSSIEDFGSSLNVRVTTKASSNRVKVEYLEDGSKIIKAYVTSLPEGGQANAEVIKLLSKELGIPKSSLSITSGLKSRNKVISIQHK